MKCLIIGSSVCDVVMDVNRLPSRAGDVNVLSHSLSLGGCAFNVARVLQGLQADYKLLSPVGHGVYGSFVRASMDALRMEYIPIDGENGCCYCFVESSGERTFVSHHGVEYSFNPRWLDDLNSDDYDYIYICGLEIEEHDGACLVEALSDMRGTIVFCPGPRGVFIDRALLDKVYALNPIVHLNDSEVMALTGVHDLNEAMMSMHGITGNDVVVTRGAHGAVHFNGTWTEVDGLAATVVDTIGAGDSHVAGYLYGLCHGMDVADRLAFANRVAGMVVGVRGVNVADDVWVQLR